MAKTITTSIVVSFTDPEGLSLLKAEIDNRDPTEGGLNVDGTTFYPGDSPIFLIFATTNVTISKIELSEGTVQSLGNTTVFVTKEKVTFANTREASLNYPADGELTVELASPGAPTITLTGQTQLTLPAKAVASYSLAYTSTATAYKLSDAAGNLDVVVYVEGTAD